MLSVVKLENKIHNGEIMITKQHISENKPIILKWSKALVDARMSNNKLQHMSYTLNCSSSSGIKTKDAIKIDAALNALKLAGNATLTSEAQSEERRCFEYEIDF